MRSVSYPLFALGMVAALCRPLAAQESGVAFWEYGTASPVVVVLHGGPAAEHSYLLPEWKRLASFSTVVFYDQRGCGESEHLPPPYSWEQHVADLDLLIRQRSRGRPVVLAGSSWGAVLALLYGLTGEEEVSGIVLSGYPGWWGPKSAAPENTPDHLLARLDSLKRGLPVEPWPEPDTLSSGQGIGGYMADSIVSTRIESAPDPRAILDASASRGSMPPEQSLAGLDIPVLIISGDRGGRIPDGGGGLAVILPQATRVIIRDAAHDPWAADPVAFFDIIREFLDDQIPE